MPRAACLAILLLSLTIPVAAQQYYGGLTGTVTDSSGAVVPNFTLVVTNRNKGTVTRVATNEAGVYRAVNLTPDPYKLEGEAKGFKRFLQDQVLVELNRVVTLDIVLEVGAATETVTVRAAPPILDTEQAASTSTVTRSVVQTAGAAVPLAETNG